MTDLYRMQGAVGDSEKKLHDLYALSPLGIALTDMSGRYLEFNEAFRAICGYSVDELNALDYWALTPPEYEVQEAEQLELLLNTGRYGSYEKEYRQKDGTRVHIRLNGTLIAGRDGQQYIWSIVEDITERKQAESALRASEERMRLFFEHQVVGMAITSPEKGLLQVNDRLCDMLGYTSDELGRLSWAELTHPDDIAADTTQFERLLNGEIDSYMLEKRFVRKVGGIIHTNLGVGCVRREEDRLVDYVLAVLEDITERKAAERQLALLHSSLDHVNDTVLLISEDASILYVNECACNILGYSREKLLSMHVVNIDPDYPLEGWPAYWLDLKTNGSLNFESRHKTSDGRIYSVDITANYVEFEGQGYNLAICRDISERKLIQETLQRNLSALEEAQRIGHIGSWDVDIVNDVLTWSDEVFRIWEIDKTRFAAAFAAFMETVHPDDREKVALAYNKSISDKTLYQVEHRLLFPDGRVKYIQERGESYFDEDGRPVRFVGTSLDITERKQFEWRLALLDNAINRVGEAIYLVDEDARILQVNNAASQMLGYSQDELLSQQIHDLDPDFGPELWRHHWNDLLVKGSITVETNHRAKSGDLIPIEVNANLIVHEGRHYNFALVRDITERRQSDEALKVSEERYRTSSLLLQSVLESSPDIIAFALDRDYRYIAFNLRHGEAMRAIWGKDIGLGMNMLDIIGDHSDRKAAKKSFDRALADESFVLEEAYGDEHLSRKFWQTFWSPIRADNGEVTGLTCFVLDITKRKQAETALAEQVDHINELNNYLAVSAQNLEEQMVEMEAAQEQLKTSLAFSESVINAIPDLLFEMDRDGRYLSVWAQNSTLLAAQKALLLNRTVHEVLTPDAAEVGMAALREAEEKGRSQGKTIRIDLPQGESWFELSVSQKPDEESGDMRFLVLSRDITERKQMQEAIAAREQEFSTLVEQAPEPIFRFAPDGRRIYVNAAVERITGIPASVLLGEPPSDGKVISADSGAMLSALVKRICETGEPGEVEVESVGADGVHRYFHNRLAPEFGADGKVRSVFSISHDITELKLNEKMLLELNLHLEENARILEEQAKELEAQQEQIKLTEAWYRGIVRSAPDGMVVVDARGHISLVNENLEKMFGYAEGELVGQPIEILLPSGMREGHVAKRNGFFAGGAMGRPMDGVLGNLQACRKDGAIFYVDVSLSRLPDADRIGVICASIRDITERKHMQDALMAREREFRTLVENLPTYVVRLDQRLHRTYVNPAFVSFVGVAEAELLGTHVGAFWSAENVSVDAYIELLTRVLCSGRQEEVTLEWRNEAGWLCSHQVRVTPEFAVDGEVQSMLVLGFDITERSRQQVLEAGRQRVFETIAHGGELNETLNQVARYIESAQPGRHCHILLHDEECNSLVSVAAPSLPAPCRSALNGIEMYEESCSCANAVLRGERIVVENLGHHVCPETCQVFARENGVAASWSEPIFDVSGKTLGVVVIYLDQQVEADSQDLALLRHASYLSSIAIERKRIESQMLHQASYDSLTGLPNRRLFGHRLREDITKAERGGDNVALFFIDLDHFKEVNDTLGHEIGDQLLTEAAGRIRACMRESDTVARLGGDEFVVILTSVEEMSHLGRLAQSIVDAMVRPFTLGEHTAYISASIGIAGYPLDADNAESLIGCADQAMYAAKEQGRNNFSFFTPAMQQQVQARMLLANDLRDALDKDQLQVWYQPIVEIATGQVSKAEALLRWKHPVRGMVPPDKFIPVAEENGLIHEIGDWVFRQAVAVAQRWNADSQHQCQISVNLSPRQFMKGNIDTVWLEHLQQLGFDPAHIVVEITEGLLLDDRSEIMKKLTSFGASGMQVALDDFGTGYSAMAYLKKFPIDYLKIDRSFVRDLETDPGDRAIAEAIVVMARKLGLKVIAEGVETAGQRDLLAAVGCEYVQGYLYAKPMPEEEFMKYLVINGVTAESGL